MKLSKIKFAFLIVLIPLLLGGLFVLNTGKNPITGDFLFDVNNYNGSNLITGNVINIPDEGGVINNEIKSFFDSVSSSDNNYINSNRNNFGNNNSGGSFSNTSFGNNSTNQNNNTNPSNGGRRGGGGRRPPIFPPSEDPNSTNPDNPFLGGNETIRKGWKFKRMPNNFNFRRNGFKINESDFFEGKTRFNLEKDSVIISEFDVNFSNDIDLSEVSADVNISEGKSFMHSPNGTFENITLYIPRVEGMNGVVICSNASSFEEVYVGCSENPLITKEYILEIGNENLSISDDGMYFLVRGITGTGGNGVNLTAIQNQTAPPDFPGNHSAIAGNVTEITITAFSTTQSWQGYFGNISGTVQLADSTDNVFYNWSLLSPQGQVYATTNSTISWGDMQCFNFSASGNHSGGETPGGTSQFGTNLTQLENLYNIQGNDVDGVNETFNLFGSGHDLFYTAHNQFDNGECRNTRIYSNLSFGEDNRFEEVLLYEPTTSSVVFTSILDEDILGFDNRSHDFEMLVLEDGHGNNTVTTIYYFFSEMQ